MESKAESTVKGIRGFKNSLATTTNVIIKVDFALFVGNLRVLPGSLVWVDPSNPLFCGVLS